MSKLKTTGTDHDTLTGYDFEVDHPLRALRSIRMKCLECCAGSAQDVRNCHIEDCTLWPYRMGKSPNRAGKGPQEPAFLRKKQSSINESEAIEVGVGVR